MKKFSFKKEKNGKANQKGNIKNRLALSSIRISQRSTQVGIRKVSSGLFQYDGIYTLSRISKWRK